MTIISKLVYFKINLILKYIFLNKIIIFKFCFQISLHYYVLV